MKKHASVHSSSKASVEPNVSCDKCEHIALSPNALVAHRNSQHSHFVYHCGLCEYKATNLMVLKTHKESKHRSQHSIIRKEKLCPLPVCDPSSRTHSSECCDRQPGRVRQTIYTHEERCYNGLCIEWNKGYCRQDDECRFEHSEIPECRFGFRCLRTDCFFWHKKEGKFPFLG